MSLIISPNQDVLVSGTNIKPVNGSSLLGSSNLITDYSLLGYGLLGSAIKGQTLGKTMLDQSSNTVLTDGTIKFMAIYVPQAVTLIGVSWYQAIQGNYTADNNNRLGLYTYSAGTLTLVASCANDGNLWKGATGAWVQKAFSSTYPAAAGIYYVGLLYNNSAQVAAPSLGSYAAPVNNAIGAADFTNSTKLICTLAGQTDLTTPQAMSGLTGNAAANNYVSVYG